MRSNEESMSLTGTQTRSQCKRGVNEPYGDSNEESMSLMTQTRSQSEESMIYEDTNEESNSNGSQ